MSDNFRGVYRPLRTSTFKAAAFTRAAGQYSQLGIDCFNQCVDPGKDVENDRLAGIEKRCMDGCLTANLQNFTIYGT